MYDLSRIEPLALKENYLFGLGFNAGFVFGRVLLREFFAYIYDEVASVAADTWVDGAMLGISGRNIDDAFAIPTRKNRIYQLFRGIAPSFIRTYLDYPASTPQHTLEAVNRQSKSLWGYIDGFERPLNNPSPKTEVWLPPQLNHGYAFYNPTNDAASPLLKFYVWRYQVQWLKDQDLIFRIMQRQTECRLVTMGGVASFDYAARDILGAEPVLLGDDKSTITRKIGGGLA